MTQTVYVTDRTLGAVLSWGPATSYGNVAPTTTISGTNTQLGDAIGLAVPAGGNIFASGDSSQQIVEFAPGTNGNANPVTTITSTLSFENEGIAADGSGNLYMSSYGGTYGNTIGVFAAGQTGTVTPTTITGAATTLNTPYGIAVDATRKLYVANSGGNDILVFAAGASGNVAPIATIGGANTTLSGPERVAVDSNGRIIVSDEGNKILVFASGANGNVAPVATIAGALTGLSSVSGVAADNQNAIWVCDAGAVAIYRFAPTANGNVAPIATISGASTTLNNPEGIAVY
jgi:sugar lactone lactonase YvrE